MTTHSKQRRQRPKQPFQHVGWPPCPLSLVAANNKGNTNHSWWQQQGQYQLQLTTLTGAIPTTADANYKGNTNHNYKGNTNYSWCQIQQRDSSCVCVCVCVCVCARACVCECVRVWSNERIFMFLLALWALTRWGALNNLLLLLLLHNRVQQKNNQY